MGCCGALLEGGWGRGGGVVLTCSLSIVPAGGPEVGGRGTSQTMGKATLVLPPCKGGEGKKRGEEGDDDRRDKGSTGFERTVRRTVEL